MAGAEAASSGQQRIWLISQLEGAGAAYNEPLAYRLRGSLDQRALLRAFDALAQRHDTLRTRLVAAEDGLRAVIDPPDRGYAVEIDDLSELADPAAQVAALRQQEAAQPFDLGGGPLARARLIVLGPKDHILLVTVHHTVFDGRSMEVLLTELSSLYANVLRDDGTGLPPLPARYADFARRQRDWSLGGEAVEQEGFGAETLAGAPPLLELPTDRPRPARQDHDGGRVPVRLEPELVAALGAVARQHRSTLFGAVLTGWTALLSRLTGQTDIVVGTPVANRRRTEYAGLIGFFVQTLALRVDLGGEPTGSELLRRTRAVLRAALDHQDVPFERVVDLVNPPRSAAHTPLFQTMLAWAPARAGLVSFPGTQVAPLDIPHAAAKFDLALSLEQDDSGVHGYLDYATALFDRDTVERYAVYLKRLLARIARDPGARVADHALTDAATEQRILQRFSGLGADSAHPVTTGEADPAGIVERFEAQVRARPHAPAVVAGKEQLDYATLQRRAARLAHALIARGVGPGACVALHCGRTVDLTVAVLGILSAGAAYLPLDPAQPPDRIAAMVTDAGPALVLTDAPGSGEGWEEIAAVEAAGERDDPPGLSVVLLDTIATDDTDVRAALGPVDAAEFRENLVRFNGMYPGIDDDQIDRYFRIYNHNRMTARAYTVPTSAARVVFVEAAPEPDSGAAADAAEPPGPEARAVAGARDFWRRKVRGGFAVETVGGGHWDLLESDEVPRIARIIAAELDRTSVPGPLPGAVAPAGPSAMLER